MDHQTFLRAKGLYERGAEWSRMAHQVYNHRMYLKISLEEVNITKDIPNDILNRFATELENYFREQRQKIEKELEEL